MNMKIRSIICLRSFLGFVLVALFGILIVINELKKIVL